jgi:hypothetical protein
MCFDDCQQSSDREYLFRRTDGETLHYAKYMHTENVNKIFVFTETI